MIRYGGNGKGSKVCKTCGHPFKDGERGEKTKDRKEHKCVFAHTKNNTLARPELADFINNN